MNKTGIVYDVRMTKHQTEDHPESPERIKKIYDTIKNAGLLNLCHMVPTRFATESELKSVHCKDHVERMQIIPFLDKGSLLQLQQNYNSVYLNNFSYECALLSAGGVTELCDYVVQGKMNNGLAIVRPPGHHAESHQAMGFCLFNNVGVAAQTMIDKYNLSRVVILDWDVHHGNATQKMFESDPKVLYISLHRYDDAKFYPYSSTAGPKVIGNGFGAGKNVNIAWNTRLDKANKVGNTEYIYAYKKLIKPMLDEYKPQLIIISAGFDSAAGDPLGGLNVTPEAFAYMTSDLLTYAEGKVVIALEGGYNLDTISNCMLACLKSLLHIEVSLPHLNGKVSPVAEQAVAETADAHKQYWQFLNNN